MKEKRTWCTTIRTGTFHSKGISPRRSSCFFFWPFSLQFLPFRGKCDFHCGVWDPYESRPAYLYLIGLILPQQHNEEALPSYSYRSCSKVAAIGFLCLSLCFVFFFMSGVSSTSEKHSEVVAYKRKFTIQKGHFSLLQQQQEQREKRERKKKKEVTQWHSKTNRNCHADVVRFRFPAVSSTQQQQKRKRQEAGRQDKQPTAGQITLD